MCVCQVQKRPPCWQSSLLYLEKKPPHIPRQEPWALSDTNLAVQLQARDEYGQEKERQIQILHREEDVLKVALQQADADNRLLVLTEQQSAPHACALKQGVCCT